MLDLIAHGAPGHAPVQLVLIWAGEIGFVWDMGRSRVGFVLLWMLSGHVQNVQNAIFEAWQH